MSIRFKSLEKLNHSKLERRFMSNSQGKPISQYFGKLVFGPDAIKKYLMRDAYESLMHYIETGEPIDKKTADFVAVGMRNWAMDNGATHFSHWFQPLTGKTAEKHDAFFKLDKQGYAIETFSGNELLKAEPDGSSFPSGGLRETHQARSYTIWDPSSSAFIMESTHGKVLCIPTIFISYNGESLDLKTPLLKSIYALDKAATDVVNYFDDKVKKVIPTLGWEQEYFIVDEALYNSRPDLMLCGRTLFGNPAAKGQQLDDHYFGSIPERVKDFMHDFEDDCLMLGIPVTTRHNEVAPTQFEVAPYFEYANVAADHNQLLMDIIDTIAKRHDLRALLHEKPYAGINGSGKHNNWSMATDTGRNLLSPGDDPSHNLEFITFFVITMKALDVYGDLLRASIANAGNEHRLGANEAPPAIISMYTGERIANILEDFKKGITTPFDKEDNTLNLKLNRIVTFKKDDTDRNRTSPFPFTGNRFEFRAVGSSVNVSNPMTVLNTMVAEQLTRFKAEVDEMIANGQDKFESIRKVLVRYIEESERIIFNGNGYSDEWVEEAAKRGLKNIKSSPEALGLYLVPEFKDIFIKNNVFSEKEIIARYNVYIEEYIKKIQIESLLVEELASTMIIPAVVKYQNKLVDNAKGLISIGLEADAMKDTIAEISGHLKEMNSLIKTMVENREAAHHLSEPECAQKMHDDVLTVMEKIREHADRLEMIVDDSIWPLAKYRELLFLH